MKIPKKVRTEIERALRNLSDALPVLEQSQGYAVPINSDRALGGDYNLSNPRCVETCANLSEHVRVFSFHGSKAVMAWTAKDILTRLLKSDE